jgi:hypothetical protein
VKEYQTCQTIQAKTKSPLPAAQFDESRSDQQAKSISAMKSTSMNELITSTLTTETSSKRDNISAGAIIPFVLVLLIVTIVCLYVLLSGRLLKGKNHGKTSDLIDKRKKQHVTSSGMPSFWGMGMRERKVVVCHPVKCTTSPEVSWSRRSDH